MIAALKYTHTLNPTLLLLILLPQHLAILITFQVDITMMMTLVCMITLQLHLPLMIQGLPQL